MKARFCLFRNNESRAATLDFPILQLGQKFLSLAPDADGTAAPRVNARGERMMGADLAYMLWTLSATPQRVDETT